MAFFEGTFLWEFSVHSNSGQEVQMGVFTEVWRRLYRGFLGCGQIPSKIVFCFWSAFYNAEQNKGNVSSIQASKRNIPAKNTPAKIHSVPRLTIKKKNYFHSQ